MIMATPKDFGLVGMVTAVIGAFSLFSETFAVLSAHH
jgi:hypothetical protein